MPTQRIPPPPLGLGFVTARRHAKLVESSGAASVKDLRLRRVVPPATAPLDSSPDRATAKPGSVETTPPEAASAAAATAQDRERKPMLPRSKLVRDPASFGYRRLLPFLNEMAKNDNTNEKGTPSENTAANLNEFSRSHSGLGDESVDGSHGEADPVYSLEPLVLKTVGDQEMKDCCDSVQEEITIVNSDLAISKPWLTRCTRSKFVHHPSSFSYKRMLPFLMENEISSQGGDRVKFRRVSEENQLTSDEDEVLASGHHHLAISKDSPLPQECNGAEVERTLEEKISVSDGNYVLNGEHLQSAVAEVSPLDGSTAKVLKVTQQVLDSDGYTLSSDKGELTSDGNDVLAIGQCQLAVSADSSEKSSVAEVERIVEEKATKSEENSVLDGSHLRPTVSEVSPQESGTAQMQKAIQKPALTSDGDEANGLTSDKGEFLAKEQPQLCDRELLKDSAELAEVQQCQSSESGCSDVGFGSLTKTVMVDVGADRHGAPEHQDTVASLDGVLLDVGMICRPSDPSIGAPLLADEMSGYVMHTESRSRKVRTLRPCGTPCLETRGLSPKKLFPFNGAPCLEKRGLSPKNLSPKKGILKRHTRGCKGICMCLDCSIFRLRADRAFEFSRKQMQEADDIIENLLNEVASLRSLTEKSSGQQEQIQAACQQASRVEEVARESRRQMLMELNSHCKIPGPRVKFAQYVEEKDGLVSSQ